MLNNIFQQGSEQQISHWILLIVPLLMIVAIAIAVVFWWGTSTAFSSTMSIVDKHWERSTILTHRVCDQFGGCSWQPRQRELLTGDSNILPSWPSIREPKRLERVKRKEIYSIELFDRDRDKVYTYKTHDYTEYQLSEIFSVHPIIINKFGKVKKILPEVISN